MKTKTIIFIAILLILTAVFAGIFADKTKTDFKPLELEVGEIFEGIDYGDTMYVLNYIIANIDGSGENDIAILVGNKESTDAMMAQKVDLVLYNTNTKEFIKTGFKNFSGTSPKILNRDFTGDGVDDLIIIMDNGDGTKNIRVVTEKENSLKEIFNKRDCRGIVFVGEMVDGFKTHLRCGKLSKELVEDLKDMKNGFITSGKYNESGKLLSNNSAVLTTGITNVELVEFSRKSGIKTTQRIEAFDGEFIIDEVSAIWEYENGKWQIVEASGTHMGALTY